MRLQTNVLTAKDLWQAASLILDVDAEMVQHGSRSHARSFTFKLSGDGPGVARRHGNSGQYGAVGYEDGYALMWDEWGIVLADLYRRDPDLVCGSVKHPTYADAADYHWQTGDRFQPQPDGTPADIEFHTHRWLHVTSGNRINGENYSLFDCKGTKEHHCTAFIRRQRGVQSLDGATS